MLSLLLIRVHGRLGFRCDSDLSVRRCGDKFLVWFSFLGVKATGNRRVEVVVFWGVSLNVTRARRVMITLLSQSSGLNKGIKAKD